MPDNLQFPEYSFVYSNNAKPQRRSLSDNLRMTLHEIEDKLTENPDQFPEKTIMLSEDIYVYKHEHPPVEVTYKVDRKKKTIYFLHLVTPVLEIAKPLFISYSHEDEEFLVELKKWLKPLEKKELIKIWDDKKIKASVKWREEIEKELNAAKAAVLLVSQNFLSSDFITEVEIPLLKKAANEKGVKILWIAVRPSIVEDTDLSDFQAVLKEPPLNQLNPSERDTEYKKIYETIKDALN